MSLFKRSLELNPKRDNSYFDIGACYGQMGQYDLALRNYALGRKVDPDDADVSFRMGRVYYKAKRFREALACLDTALETSERGATHFYRGLVVEALGNTAEARIAYQKSLTLDFDN